MLLETPPRFRRSQETRPRIIIDANRQVRVIGDDQDSDDAQDSTAPQLSDDEEFVDIRFVNNDEGGEGRDVDALNNSVVAPVIDRVSVEGMAGAEGVEQNVAAGGVEQNVAIGDVELNVAAGGVEQNVATGGVEQNVAAGGVEQNFAVGVVEQNFAIGDVEQNFATGGVEQNVSAGGVEQNVATGEVEQNDDANRAYALKKKWQRKLVFDMAEISFNGHFRSVYSGAIHPKLNLAATGGEDNLCYVWHTITGKKVCLIRDHNDTVSQVSWNNNGKYLTTGDMSGKIRVHRLEVKRGDNDSDDVDAADDDLSAIWFTTVWEYSIGDMSWVRWHYIGNILFAGVDRGDIFMWYIPKCEYRIMHGHGMRCEAVTLCSDHRFILAGYTDGVFKLWHIQKLTVVMQIDNQHRFRHTGGLITVAAAVDIPLFASGGFEGTIVISNISQPLLVVETEGPVETLAFSPYARIFASGTAIGTIYIMSYPDCKRHMRLTSHKKQDGITKLIWISEFILLAASIHGLIHIFDIRTGEREHTFKGHCDTIRDLQYCPRTRLILSASDDHVAKIFKVPEKFVSGVQNQNNANK